jgi:hypothetical protein
MIAPAARMMSSASLHRQKFRKRRFQMIDDTKQAAQRVGAVHAGSAAFSSRL